MTVFAYFKVYFDSAPRIVSLHETREGARKAIQAFVDAENPELKVWWNKNGNAEWVPVEGSEDLWFCKSDHWPTYDPDDITETIYIEELEVLR